ncbi:MAG: hypothetical protein A2Z57_10810 [Planctomycetes bacterium RIFCSPHIGHO2_12_39_6]|nr:MAG: hypothetical protein A2Z57_10810 [Planctomycetes bacterium RIFCSPHIGHO2_12_39_6]
MDSPLKRGDKGVCKFSATHPQPLFLEGKIKAVAKGSLIFTDSISLTSNFPSPLRTPLRLRKSFFIKLAQCLFPASLHKIPVKLVKDEKI